MIQQSKFSEQQHIKYGLGIYLSFKEFSVEKFMAKRKEFRSEVRADVVGGVKCYTQDTMPMELRKKYFSKLVTTDTERLFPFHYESVTKLVYIYIPQNTICTTPITLRTRQEQGAGAVHYIIVAGKNSTATIIDRLETSAGAYALSTVHEMYIEEGAEVHYYHTKQMDEKMFHFNKTILAVEEKAKVTAMEFVNGGSFVQHSYKTLLRGTLVKNSYVCGFLAPQQVEYDLFTESVHSKPDTKSMMIVKGLVADKAKVISRSNIQIEREAAGTQSQERADLLLLGNTAQGEAVPMLEVATNDVQCAHGSTVSKINDEHLFYLQSRGISDEEAKQILSVAFVSSVIDMFPESMQMEIRGGIDKSISK